jgi:hypothetical protein
MPKATAVWLVDNTKLSFEQIAEFCGLHPLEVQGIADGDVAQGVIGQDPVLKGLTTRESIKEAELNEKLSVEFTSGYKEYLSIEKKRKKAKYTPVARRQDKPDAIAWIIKNHPEINDLQISKLIGTTKKTIADIRSKSHWNMNNLKPRDPVLLGLCTQTALEASIQEAKDKQIQEKAEKEAKKIVAA